MTVVSTKEFNSNQEKYFEMALTDHIIIKRGDDMFIVQNYLPDNEPYKIFDPDEDFYRSISMEELRASAHEHIDKLFSNQ